MKAMFAGLAVLAATAFAAHAQKEQWLQYHVSQEGRGYRYLDLTTNPPPNVALPKLNAQPFFAKWTTPMDPAGARWLCFDRTRKSGPYDRVFYDSTGNGKLEEKSAVTAKNVDQYNAMFDPIRFVFKGEDGPITYHLILRFMKYDTRDERLLISSGGYYDGMVDIGGKKRRVELVDANANGAFNDRSSDAGSTDRIMIEGDRMGDRYLGKMVEVDEQFYRVEVAQDGAFLKVQKAENVVTGKVRVPDTIANFSVVGDNGNFTRKPAKGELTLPVGQYRVNSWEMKRKDDRGAEWQVSAYNFDKTADFEVAAGKTISMEVGEPIRAVMQAADFPTNSQVSFSLRFMGKYNETLSIRKGDQDPPGPRLTLTSLDGSYRYTNKFEFG
jgi:hypothetical protein